MWNKLSIRYKIPSAILGFSLAVGFGVGAGSYLSASGEIEHLTEERLRSVAESRVTELADYMDSIKTDLTLVSSLPYTFEAVEALKDGWHSIPDNHETILKEAYIRSNPNPVGQKHLLNAGPKGTDYDQAHGKYHPWFRELLLSRGYYDIFLFDIHGDLVYSVFKEEDFATNFLKDGPWVGTDLGKAFRAAVSSPANAVHFFDFAPYAPSHGTPASFISTPIVKNGETAGVLVFQMPIDRINTVMSHSSGLGESGETIIVGEDNLLRNDSRFTDENDILKTRIENEAATQALKGKPAVTLASGHSGDDFIQASHPFEFLGTKWAVVALQAQDEAMAPLMALKLWMLAIGSAFFVMAVFGGTKLARSLTRPLDEVISNIQDLIEGRLDTKVTGTKRADEIGAMKRAIEVFRDNAVSCRLADETAASRRASEDARRQELDRVISAFKATVSDVQNQLSNQTKSMTSTSEDMVQIAERSSHAAEGALRASKVSDESVQASASAAEELRISIEEINQHTVRALDITRETSMAAEATDADVTELSGAADKIGTVIAMIREIADQTNLLALNATIEAARAGEAGKGFAVVAAEVKELSNQTAKATDQISNQIAAVQSSTRRAVNAIRSIGSQIGNVQEVTAAIASAVEEQGAATGEISKAITMAAQSSSNAAENVSRLQDNICQTRSTSVEIENLSANLGQVSSILSEAVETFLASSVWKDDSSNQLATQELAGR